MNTELYPHQIEALKRMHNGCILAGGVGSGKSRTALAYVFIHELGGSLRINGKGVYADPELPKDIYIITTAKKRDEKEWDEEVAYFGLQNHVKVTVDSWNNLPKYKNTIGAMFIFDEQRIVGSGAWVKSFLKIAKRNHWILLSATPGDDYQQYIPVLIANGYYRSRSQFKQEHMVFKPYMNFPCLDHYIGTKRLDFYIAQILVTMEFTRNTVRHYEQIVCNYDKDIYKKVMKERWNPYDDCPIEETGKLCYLLRKVSNDSTDRLMKCLQIVERHKKVIIFYNFSYELYALRYLFSENGFEVKEWNGEKHEPVPTSDKWVYLVQYSAGSEGWNCITTDTMIFYSQNYSYKVFEQASGRIDRLTTPFKDLYYYCLRSMSPIDISIKRALNMKKNFNEKIFLRDREYEKSSGRRVA